MIRTYLLELFHFDQVKRVVCGRGVYGCGDAHSTLQEIAELLTPL
jgi:hypothetical protein